MRGIEHVPWAYDLFMEGAERLGRLGEWRRRLVGPAQGRILDLGCGTGRNLRLFRPDSQVTGLELDLRLLAAARRRAPSRPLVVARAEQMPFRADSFDTVVSSLVFCSVADPSRGLQEVKRILDWQGQVRMLEHVRSSNRVMGRLQDLIQPAWTWFPGGCPPTRSTVEPVEGAGFVIAAYESPDRTTLRCFVARDSRTAPAAD